MDTVAKIAARAMQDGLKGAELARAVRKIFQVLEHAEHPVPKGTKIYKSYIWARKAMKAGKAKDVTLVMAQGGGIAGYADLPKFEHPDDYWVDRLEGKSAVVNKAVMNVLDLTSIDNE